MSGNSKAIRNRIKSVESTRQITKAMGLVASSKLGRAKERVERTRPYFNLLHKTLTDISYANRDFSSAYVAPREIKKSCYVVIAGDRGLAGGYNSNVFKLAQQEIGNKDAVILPIGKKCVEYFDRRAYPVLSKDWAEVAKLQVSDCYELARFLCDGFLKGEFDEIHLVYTNFVSMLQQAPGSLKLLPLNCKREAPTQPEMLLIYEPSSEAVFDAIVPEYLAGLLYGGVCESACAEVAARHTSMDAASKNADEMIDKLQLSYNRARQAAITQEITEIVGGSGQ